MVGERSERRRPKNRPEKLKRKNAYRLSLALPKGFARRREMKEKESERERGREGESGDRGNGELGGRWEGFFVCGQVTFPSGGRCYRSNRPVEEHESGPFRFA